VYLSQRDGNRVKSHWLIPRPQHCLHPPPPRARTAILGMVRRDSNAMRVIEEAMAGRDTTGAIAPLSCAPPSCRPEKKCMTILPWRKPSLLPSRVFLVESNR
jgi:hypothetical protein